MNPLPFERRILELERQLEKSEDPQERHELEAELARERETVYSNLSAWQRVELARHPQRPTMLDFIDRVFEDFFELHGDRLNGDDAAIVGGIARFRGRTVMVVGQQKGSTTEERVKRNFGNPHPQGYRKALRLFKLAERLKFPVVTLVDTQGADPGIESEAHGQGPAIATNLLEMLSLDTPMFTAILGQGGSGGALGIAVADRVAMFENAIYAVCMPERCAEILWKDIAKKESAASVMRITAAELQQLGVVDCILREPPSGAHRDHDGAADSLAQEIERFLDDAEAGQVSLELRQKKFRQMGAWLDAPAVESASDGPELEVIERAAEADAPNASEPGLELLSRERKVGDGERA
jgi:acetyl-CoA carboxylase carboxyl transferase subunit alpha